MWRIVRRKYLCTLRCNEIDQIRTCTIHFGIAARCAVVYRTTFSIIVKEIFVILVIQADGMGETAGMAEASRWKNAGGSFRPEQ